MSTFTFNFNGQPIKISGPPGATEAQARAIFEQQAKTGALVGLKSGDRIGPAQQAAGSVPGASSALGQAASGVPGSTTGALGTAFNTVGKTFVSSTSNNSTDPRQLAANITRSTRGAAPANGITTADFAKTDPALSPMQRLSATDVRASVSQAAATSGQKSTTVSNNGVGTYALDGPQLERAGLIKPGTVSTYLASNANSLTDVVKSPTVWTGKGGVNNLDDFLSNPRAQSSTQQGLMSSGLSTVKALGIPVAALSAKALGGVSLNAAKSPAQTADWAKGQLPPAAQANFDSTARDGAFAVGLADQKLNDAMTQKAPPGEAENTVNRATVDAAATRVVGNDKVPSLAYGSTAADPELVAENKALRKEIGASLKKIIEVDTPSATAANASAKIAQLTAIRSELEATKEKAVVLRGKTVNAKPYSESLYQKLNEEVTDIASAISNINDLIKLLKQLK